MISRTELCRGVVAVTVCLGLAAPAVAVADTSHTTTIAQVMVVEAGHKDYKQFHGAIWLEIDKATTNYRWGGAQCAGKDVSESTVQLLFAAFRGGDQVTLEYSVVGNKDKPYRCVTAVTFSK
jgi:hypothetical protein